jgi:hypothetical protein
VCSETIWYVVKPSELSVELAANNRCVVKPSELSGELAADNQCVVKPSELSVELGADNRCVVKPSLATNNLCAVKCFDVFVAKCVETLLQRMIVLCSPTMSLLI